MKDFFTYVDRGGKMTILSLHPTMIQTHPYYIRYVNNRPVAYHGPADVLVQDVTGSKVWCYASNSFIDIASLSKE